MLFEKQGKTAQGMQQIENGTLTKMSGAML